MNSDQKKGALTDSSIARMAGNIAAGLVMDRSARTDETFAEVARDSVKLARLIAAELDRASQGEDQP